MLVDIAVPSVLVPGDRRTTEFDELFRRDATLRCVVLDTPNRPVLVDRAAFDAALTGRLTAQTASAPASGTSEESDDVVVLSDFAVNTSRDVGYRATNSIAATRSNTPIKDVPLNIQVFTKDLYDDLQIQIGRASWWGRV